LLQLLSLAPEQRVAAIAALQDRAAGPGVELAQLERAVIERLAQIP
jgi:hypothetical protein